MDQTAGNSSGSNRPLGNSGLSTSPIGFGAWAIGGPAYRGDFALGWGEVDDDESVAAIHAALDAGVTFIDTAPGYGAGHSERVIGRALAGRRDQVVIGTKFGVLIDEEHHQHREQNASPASIREQCDESLERLGIETIDLYQFHIGDYDIDKADEIVAVLEELVAAGKIRTFGWSTDDAARIAAFARSPLCSAAQLRFNLVEGSADALATIESHHLAGVVRSPLAMGVLTGKFTKDSTFADNDIRRTMFNFGEGKQQAALEAIERARAVLTSGGRTLAQGALCWLLARSPAFVPIPGIRTVAQAQENAGAIVFGPFDGGQMAEINGAIAELRPS